MRLAGVKGGDKRFRHTLIADAGFCHVGSNVEVAANAAEKQAI